MKIKQIFFLYIKIYIIVQILSSCQNKSYFTKKNDFQSLTLIKTSLLKKLSIFSLYTITFGKKIINFKNICLKNTYDFSTYKYYKYPSKYPGIYNKTKYYFALLDSFNYTSNEVDYTKQEYYIKMIELFAPLLYEESYSFIIPTIKEEFHSLFVNYFNPTTRLFHKLTETKKEFSLMILTLYYYHGLDKEYCLNLEIESVETLLLKSYYNDFNKTLSEKIKLERTKRKIRRKNLICSKKSNNNISICREKSFCNILDDYIDTLYTKFSIFPILNSTIIEETFLDKIKSPLNNHLTNDKIYKKPICLSVSEGCPYTLRLLLNSFPELIFEKCKSREDILDITLLDDYVKFQNNSIKLILELIDEDIKNNLLYKAVKNHRFKKTKLLLNYGADPNLNIAYDIFNLAIFNDSDVKMVKLLLDYGIDPCQSSGLEKASNLGYLNIVNLTLSYNSCTNNRSLDRFLNQLASNTKKNKLEIYIQIAKLFLDKGANPNEGMFSAISYGNIKLVKIYLEYGANPRKYTFLYEDHLKTAINCHLGDIKDCIEISKILIDKSNRIKKRKLYK